MRFERTSLSEGLRRVRGTGLLEACYDTTVTRSVRLRLDDEFYEQMDDQAFAVLAYDEANRLIGFCSVFIGPHQHTCETCATNDAIYVLPGHPLVGGRLVKEVEKQAMQDGATRFQWFAPVGGAFEKALLKRPSYVLQQVMFEKELF